jgi:two-component system, sensor histidine kinase
MSTPSTVIPEKYRDQALVEAIDRMYRMLTGPILFMPLLPAVLAVSLWGRVNSIGLGIWLVAAVSVPLMRYALLRWYRRQRADVARAAKWAQWITRTALFDGLVWGIAGVAFLLHESVPLQMLLITMIVGISAGSIFVTSFWPATEYAYSIPAVGLTALGLLWHGASGEVGMAVGMFIYLAILYRIMQQAHATAMNAIYLHFENIDLVGQLREQKEFAEQANIAKSKFLAAASHDLRQPLHALGLFVAALSERTNHAESRILIDNINRSVGALEGLFNALLDISKLDAGTVEPVLRNVRLGPLLSQLSSEYEPQASAKGLTWRCSGCDVVVVTDPALLETILRNLISNAIRYTKNGGVDVTCLPAGDGVVVEVADTGIGIASDHHREIFGEFVQLHNPERDRTKGLGLGLAIVDRLTKLLHHRLELHSTSGTGSVFRLSMPSGDTMAVPDAAITVPPGHPEPARDGVRVLVIDDETAVRDAMSVLLEDWGYEVIAVSSLDEALAALDVAPDAIIADYRLREERTGADAIRALHRRFALDVPALIVTGDTAPERIIKAKQSGFALLHKPVPPAKLRAFLRAVGARRTTRTG